MKRTSAIILLIMMLFINAVPVLAAEMGRTAEVDKPYEKVVAKNGSWYSERLTFDNGAELVIAYDGKYEIEDSLLSKKQPEMEFKINEKLVLKGIYLPYANKASQPVLIKLVDEKGNVYGPFNTEAAFANIIVEKSVSGKEAAKDSEFESTNYVFTPENEIILPEGKYKMTVSQPLGQVRNKETGAGGAFLIKGVNYAANERYKEKVQELESKNSLGKKRAETDEKLGNEEFAGINLDKYKYEAAEKPPEKKPIVFSLATESLVGEIIINTFNEGKGAEPGIISIQDEKGSEIAAFQSVGGTLGKVTNGVWAVVPNIVLPAGNYKLVVSDPNAVTYDKFGSPQFYVTVAPPPVTRYDFTGTYRIDLETHKTSTLMGAVQGKDGGFSLKDFELAILDKDGTVEFVGKYEGMPFSQGCKIIEETQDKVVATFDFSADLSKLPYKAKIGAKATLTLVKPKNGKAKIDITGTGTYAREATKDKGGDFNTHSIKAVGVMEDKNLPPFVITALGKTGSAGNIPGPDNATQAATGLLFPPLVGIVVHVLQEMLKPKPQAPKIKKFSPEWYAQQYPGKSREQLAWIMLADAMGNTDEPDEGDAESIGDNEKTGGEDYRPPAEDTQEGAAEGGISETEAEEESEEATNEDLQDKADSIDPQDSVNSQGTETEKQSQTETSGEEEKAEQPPQQAEPETLTLQVDHTGRTATYVKDAATGEWVNEETGGVLDMERYQKDVAPNFEKDKAFIDEQRNKLEKGDTAFDKEIRAAAQARKEAEQKDAYMDKMVKKYGTSDKAEIDKIINEQQEKELESAKAWNKAADRYGYAEDGATVVGVLADAGVDGLANMTGPVGKGIRAGYKVVKGAAGSMAEDGVSAANFASGAVKGGADALTDFIDNPYKKAIVTVGGEVIGGAIGDGAKGAKDGLVDGISKVITGTITDKIGGNGYGNEMTTMALNNGNVRVAIKSGEKWIGKNLSEASTNAFVNKKLMSQGWQSTVKATSGLLDEFGIQPNITEPIKASYK